MLMTSRCDIPISIQQLTLSGGLGGGGAESDVCGRQILTSKVYPRTVRVKYF